MKTSATSLDTDSRELASLLGGALRRNEFHLVYQPQVSVSTGELVGVEALLRWQHPRLGLVAPDRFVALAEQSGGIREIGDWVLRRACLVARKWQRLGLPPVRMTVNVSAVQLRDKGFAARIERLLDETGLDPRRLGVELTETALMQDVDGAIRQLLDLRARGIEIALDDFGTGCSSLSHLRRLPLDVVKIDQSLVPGVTGNSDALPIVRAIIAMAHSLGLKVLAEGVCSEAQLELLAANRCDFFQGFHFSPPVPAEQVETMLLSKRSLPVPERRRATRVHRLLAIDADAFALARLRQKVAQHFGDRVETTACSSAQAALEKMSRTAYDVIACSLQLPKTDGIAVLREARRQQPNAVRIMLIGPADLARVIDDERQVDVFRYVAKPSTNAQFCAHFGAAFEQVDRQRAQAILLGDLVHRDRLGTDQAALELARLEQSEPGITRGPIDELELPSQLLTMPGDLWVEPSQPRRPS